MLPYRRVCRRLELLGGGHGGTCLCVLTSLLPLAQLEENFPACSLCSQTNLSIHYFQLPFQHSYFPLTSEPGFCVAVLVVVTLCKATLKKQQWTWDGKINTSLFLWFLLLLWQPWVLMLRDSLLLTSSCPYPLADRNMSRSDLLCTHSCFCESVAECYNPKHPE